MLPLVVALVITLDACPWLPSIQVNTFADEWGCQKAAEMLTGEEVRALYPVRSLFPNQRYFHFHWSCTRIST